MPILLRLAARNLTRHPWRSGATALGIALGIAAVLATLSVGANATANVRAALEAATGNTDLLIAPGTDGRAVFAATEVLATTRATPGVQQVREVLEYRAEPLQALADYRSPIIPGVASGFLLSGRETDNPALPATLQQGSLPTAGEGGIALSSTFAQTRGLGLGDSLDFATQFGEVSFEITGLLDAAIGLASTNGGRVGVVHLEDLQTALRLAGRVSFLEVVQDEQTDGQTSMESLRQRLQTRLGEGVTVTRPALSGDLAPGVLETLQAGLRVLAGVLVALAGFLAYNTFAASVVERRRETALLRTLCLTQGQVQRLALLEAALVSLVGVALGLMLGVGLSYGVTRVNAAVLGYEPRTLVVPVAYVLLAGTVGVGVALVAGWLPARAASRISPLAAAQQSDTATTPPAHPLGWAMLGMGVAAALAPWRGGWALYASVAAMTLLFVGITLVAPTLLRVALTLFQPLLERVYGVPGRLGASFALRNAARNSVAIGTVVVGTALTIGVGAMVAGINQAIERWVATTITGDLFVTSPVGFPAGFADEVTACVAEIDEVSGVSVRVVRLQLGDDVGDDAGETALEGGRQTGRSVALILVDPARFNPAGGFGSFQFISGQGDAARGYETLEQGGVLAANTLHDRFGVAQGDRVRLRTRQGFQDFEVGGVVVDFTGGGEAFVASLALLERFGGGQPDLFVMTIPTQGSVSAAQQALQEAFPELYLDATPNEAYRERILSLTRQSFTATNGLLAVAVTIAALGVANTLGMNLSGRQHELATLRTLGFTRRGVRDLIAAESLVIVVLGTLLGIAVGVLLADVVTTASSALTGFRIRAVIPWPLLLGALVASPGVGLVAAFWPARRAARLEPVVALGGGRRV